MSISAATVLRKRSAVAAILDGYGGWHVAVEKPHQMWRHHRPGQLCLVVPDFTVIEPVPWDDIPSVINRAQAHIEWWIKTRNDPETLEHPAVKLYNIRKLRGFNTGTVNLYDIVET
jgi:hypothetical protein